MKSYSSHRAVVAAVAVAAAIAVALIEIAMTGAYGAAAAVPAVPTPIRLRASAEPTVVQRGCPVTGDLVFSPEGTNQGNPAEVAQRLCEQHP